MYSSVGAHRDLRALVAGYAVPFPGLAHQRACEDGEWVAARWVVKLRPLGAGGGQVASHAIFRGSSFATMRWLVDMVKDTLDVADAKTVFIKFAKECPVSNLDALRWLRRNTNINPFRERMMANIFTVDDDMTPRKMTQLLNIVRPGEGGIELILPSVVSGTRIYSPRAGLLIIAIFEWCHGHNINVDFAHMVIQVYIMRDVAANRRPSEFITRMSQLVRKSSKTALHAGDYFDFTNTGVSSLALAYEAFGLHRSALPYLIEPATRTSEEVRRWAKKKLRDHPKPHIPERAERQSGREYVR